MCTSQQTSFTFKFAFVTFPSQVNFDPISHDSQLLSACVSYGIQLVAYSSLGTQHAAVGPEQKNPVLSNPEVVVSTCFPLISVLMPSPVSLSQKLEEWN